MENAVLKPSKSFLALKKSTLGFCRLLKDCCLKNWEKHRANTLSTNRFLMITFLILLRSLGVYILKQLFTTGFFHIVE